jgi:hypothetical protein
MKKDKFKIKRSLDVLKTLHSYSVPTFDDKKGLSVTNDMNVNEISSFIGFMFLHALIKRGQEVKNKKSKEDFLKIIDSIKDKECVKK